MDVAQDAIKLVLTTTMANAQSSATSLPGHRPCHMKHTMNHGTMSHGEMNAQMDMGHDMPGMKMCKMSMTLNSDYENLCILTDKIMVTSKMQLVLAMLGIALFTFGYEYFKLFGDKMQERYSQFLKSNMVTENERFQYKLRLSCLYAFSVGYSFIIMLLFMTFNTWVMLSVCIGAGLGHFAFDRRCPTPSLVCH